MKNTKEINFKIPYILGIIEIIMFFLQGFYPYGAIVPAIGTSIIILYILTKLLSKQPINLISNKIDAVVVFLAATAFVPLIFNKYVSLHGTITRILNFINALGVYFLFKDLLKQETIKNVFLKILVVFMSIMILIGIVQLCTNYTDFFSKMLFLQKNGENRLSSLFGSPNLLAPLIASVFFINLTLIYNEQNIRKKTFYETLNFIFISGIILTYCKMIFVIFPVMLVSYFILNRKLFKTMFFSLFFNVVLSIIFALLFEKLYDMEKYIEIGITLIIFIGLSFFITLLHNKNKIKFKSVKSKLFIIFILLSCIIGFVFISNMNSNLIIFSNDLERTYHSKILSNILPNYKYNFKFDIYSKTENDFTINIIERDNKNKVIKEHKSKIENYDGIKDIEIMTSSDTNEIKIEFYTNNSNNENTLIIREFYLNDEKKILEYNILPTKLINKIGDINFKYKTLVERIEMIKSSLKLSIPNILTGLGGEAWRYKQQEVIDYEYNSNYIHSYPFQVLLEFGIIAFLTHCIFILLIIYYLIKNNKDIHFVGITFALLVIILHSILDTDLEQTFAFNYYYALIAIISTSITISNEKNKEIKNYVSNIILTICLVITIYISSTYNISFDIVKYLNIANGMDINSREYKTVSTLLYYENQKYIKYERYNFLDKYYDIIKYATYSNISDKEEVINTYIQKIKEYENKELYDQESIMKKINISQNVIKVLEKNNYARCYDSEIDELENIIMESYDTTLTQLENYYIKTYKTDEYDINYIKNIKEKYEAKKNNIVEVAKAEVGNKGGKKYWYWYGYDTDTPWCACFISWCAKESEDLQNRNIPFFSNCDDGVQWFKEKGKWISNTQIPKGGDIIFFDQADEETGLKDGISDHVGIVEKVDFENKIVYTIQGNTPNNACEEKSYSLDDERILGYGII